LRIITGDLAGLPFRAEMASIFAHARVTRRGLVC
jgi:hypothetical protein